MDDEAGSAMDLEEPEGAETPKLKIVEEEEEEEEERKRTEKSGEEEEKSESGGRTGWSDDAVQGNFSESPLLPSKQDKTDCFNWSEYLQEINAAPAPVECFFQALVPPRNDYKDGMKVEAKDPRGPGKLCLATVEEVQGQWIRVRLDGCDASNDQWVMCDDDNVRHVGFTEETRQTKLEPPVGYMFNIAKFSQFLEKQLTEGKVAPRNIVKPISAAYRPKKNQFQLGQKLEAVDIKNFSGCLSVATVIGKEGNQVELNFDGWQSGYNLVCSYDSRWLFPVGWGRKADLDLLPPPKPKKGRRMPDPGRSKLKHSLDKKLETKPPEPKPMPKPRPEPIKVKKRPPEPTAVVVETKKRKKEKKAEKPPPPEPLVEESSTGAKKEIPEPEVEKRSMERSRSPARARKTIGRPASPQEPAKDIVILSNDHSAMEVFVNRECSPGPFIRREAFRTQFPAKFGPATHSHVVQQCVQLLLNCGQAQVFHKITRGQSAISVSADIDGRCHVRRLPVIGSQTHAWEYMQELMGAIRACPKLLTADGSACLQCSPIAKKPGKRVSSPASETSESSSKTEGNGSTPWVADESPEQWSVEQVAKFVASVGDPVLSEALILDHQIDGKAMLMLTPELVMKHMGLKLGPALKLFHLVEKLKTPPGQP